MLLVGAEDVRHAASTMRGAADAMVQVALSLDHISLRHERSQEEFLQRLEAEHRRHEAALLSTPRDICRAIMRHIRAAGAA